MKSEFKNHLDSILGERESLSVLVGNSGGLDSMVLTHLLVGYGAKVTVAHCNFSLRGAESDGDEEFVWKFCKDMSIGFHSVKFLTKEESEKTGKGIQETARDLRYEWFDELKSELGLDFIVTAHHKDDQLETIIHHFLRGSGPRGMVGIRPISGDLLRPLLKWDKDDLEQFAKENDIAFRSDSSNADTKYLRNKIRLDILPILREINPNLNDTVARQVSLYNEYLHLGNSVAKNFVHQLEVKRNAEKRYSIEQILKSGIPTILIECILSEYEATPSDVRTVMGVIGSQTGKRIDLRDISVHVDRGDLVLARRTVSQSATRIFQNINDLEASEEFEIKVLDSPPIDFDPSPKVEYLCLDKIKFPLTLRTWKEGDRIQPLGMDGHQKVSDLLTQVKYPTHKRGEVYIVQSEDEIIWVIGVRMSENYRLTDPSTNILRIKWVR